MPGDQVLQPSKLIGGEGLAETNGGVHREVTKVIRGKWDFIADGLADGGNVLDQAI